MADDEIPDKTAADDLDPAFDSIDDTMKNVPPREVSVTPEALAQIVNEAVAKAITAYKQGLTESGEPARDGVAPRDPSKPAVPQTPWRAKLEQLQGDMGIDEIEFDGPPAEPAETIIHRQLSAQMGVHDFEFDEAPAVAGERAAPTRTEADAMAGWATPVQDAAPAATPDVDRALTPAAAEQSADVAEKFDWIAAEFEKLGASTEAEHLAAPPVIEPVIKPVIEPVIAPVIEPVIERVIDRVIEPVIEPVIERVIEPAQNQAPKAVAPAIEEPPAPKQVARKPVAPKPVTPTPVALKPVTPKPVAPKPVTPKQLTTKPPQPVTPKQEVPEKRSTLASWFRSALTDRPQEPEQKPAAVTPVAQPAAPPMAVAPPAPAPEVIAPPPIVRPPAAEARPAPDQAAAAKPVAPEEAAKTIFFTFDPILPVPPRLPREPKEPPKKR